uniref:Uncharacterized protein n=1 Tax=Brassica campestris TaxID=3711 RepID=A0A3P5ZSY0_BRACM|nr:unnamed protein product [Brassica rapa]
MHRSAKLIDRGARHITSSRGTEAALTRLSLSPMIISLNHSTGPSTARPPLELTSYVSTGLV